MKSMTGYGACTSSYKDISIEVVVSSLNHRYLEYRFHLPDIYQSLKGYLKKWVEKQIPRGFVELYIIRGAGAFPLKSPGAEWSPPQALKWQKVFRQMSEQLKLKNNLDLCTLSGLPGVLHSRREVILSHQEKQVVRRLVVKALQNCVKEKEREGLSLKKTLTRYAGELLKEVARIQKIQNRLVKAQKLLLKKKSASVPPGGEDPVPSMEKSGGGVEPERASHREVSDGLARQDIEEELCRLKEHIRAFRSLFSVSGPCGKKMSFYLQEMIRESNTAGSKSQDLTLIHRVVHVKSLIEQMREQVQNVE